MSNAQPGTRLGAAGATVVYIVEGDESVRSSLERLLHAAGIEPRAYESPQRFVEEMSAEPRACLLVDMTLVGTTARELRTRLREHEIVLPVIAVSVRDDVQVRRSARELGAMLFLRKPVDDQALLDAIEWATGSG